MASLEMIRTFIEYHLAITGRVWDSIDRITEDQFVSDDAYSRGSIRNLMVHLANTDRNLLNGLKNLPDIREEARKYEDFLDRASARTYWDAVAKDLAEYVNSLSEAELDAYPTTFPASAGRCCCTWSITEQIIAQPCCKSSPYSAPQPSTRTSPSGWQKDSIETSHV